MSGYGPRSSSRRDSIEIAPGDVVAVEFGQGALAEFTGCIEWITDDAVGLLDSTTPPSSLVVPRSSLIRRINR